MKATQDRAVPEDERCQEVIITQVSRSVPVIKQCAYRGYLMPDGSRYCGWHGGAKPGGKPQDGLPETMQYRDDGCDLHDKCLTCPLSQCRYEMGPGEARSELKWLELKRLLDRGMTLTDAALCLGISLRQAIRIRNKAA